MRPGTTLAAIHSTAEACFNERDINGLMGIYAEDATMVLADGTTARGLGAIREQWLGFLATDGRLVMRSRFAIPAGELAVLSSQWRLEIGKDHIAGTATEIAQQQPDGGWLCVIDHPFAGSEPDELAGIMAALGPPTTSG